MEKESVIKLYKLNKRQVFLIETYIKKIRDINERLNLVGTSTLNNQWDRHINDSLQLSNFIPNKKSSIIDLGTGGGFPGLILQLYGYNNILLTESKLKKLKFIKEFADENKIAVKQICSRVEKIKNQKFDFITCRAFAPLTKILDYSLIFVKKNTSLLFLKGRSVKNEINDAKKLFNFHYNLHESKSVGGGFVLSINNLSRE